MNCIKFIFYSVENITQKLEIDGKIIVNICKTLRSRDIIPKLVVITFK